MKKIYIWSNFDTDLSRISAITADTSDIHVFINGAVPYFKKPGFFDQYHKILFVRKLSNGNIFYAEETIKPYLNRFQNIYMVFDAEYDFITKIDYRNINYGKSKNRIMFTDSMNTIKSFSDSPRYGRSTGFATYLFIKQMFPDREIVLVNFNRKTGNSYHKTGYQNHHNIDQEELFYKNHKIKNIII